MRKSKKKLKNPHDFLLPYLVTFPVDVHIQVNNVHSFFPANQKVELTLAEYETAMNSTEYGQYLK